MPEPSSEYRFCDRKWKFDFAYPDKMVAIEIEGGVWVAGRHNSAAGFIKDCEKYNTATSLGWRVLRFPSTEIFKAHTIDLIYSSLLLNDRHT